MEMHPGLRGWLLDMLELNRFVSFTMAAVALNVQRVEYLACVAAVCTE